jgi:hypothetical protein
MKYALLIRAYVEYFRSHPTDRAGLAFVEVDPALGRVACLTEEVGHRWVAWLQTHPAWSPGPITHRLRRQMRHLEQATVDEQRQFQGALRRAIAQLDFGEDR